MGPSNPVALYAVALDAAHYSYAFSLDSNAGSYLAPQLHIGMALR